MQPEAMAFMRVHSSGERETVPRNTHHETNAASGGSESCTSTERARESAVMVAGEEEPRETRGGDDSTPSQRNMYAASHLRCFFLLHFYFFKCNFHFLRAEVMSETKASALYTDNSRTEAECQGSEPTGVRALLLRHPGWEDTGSFPIQGRS